MPIDINKLESMEAHEIEKKLPGIFAADFTGSLGIIQELVFLLILMKLFGTDCGEKVVS